MGHYDSCREGYCSSCGAAPGNFRNGECEFCAPKRKAVEKEAAKKEDRGTEREAIAELEKRVARIEELLKGLGKL